MAGESIRFNASLNTAGFDSGAARLQQIAAATSGKVSASFASMGAKIASVIAPFVGLYAAINSVKNALDMGGRLNDLSKTTGETAGNLAILERAFQNAGVGGERMGMAIASMSNFITDFQKGSKSASESMDRLGISMADLAGKSPIEQMQVFMSAIAGIRDPALRTALAMDVFKKAGKEIVPLAQDFSGELSNAKSELGSLPRILDENAASLDQLGDRLGNAVGNKLTELAVGFAAGVTGANNLADALATIDAAGLGEKLGQSLKAAFAAPLEVLQGIGEILISGVLEAGNSLRAAFKYAVEVYYEMMKNPGFYQGLETFLSSMFAKVGEGFVGGIISSMKTLFGLMDWNPLWRPFLDAARGQLDEIQKKVTEAGESASVWMEQGALEMQAAFNGAVEDSKYVYEDALGAAEHYKQGLAHFENAKTASEQIKNDAAQTAQSLAEGSAALSEAYENVRGFNLGAASPTAGNPMLSANTSGLPDFFRGNSPAPNTPTVLEDHAQARGSGGGARGGGYSSGRDALTENQRVAQMRGEYYSRPAAERAGELYNNRMFRSAVAAEDRAKRIKDRHMESANLRDAAAGFNYAGRAAGNTGEALEALRDQVGHLNVDDELKRVLGQDYNSQQGELANFENYLKKQLEDGSIPPGAREELGGAESQGKGRPSKDDKAGKGASGNLATEATLRRILEKIQERPILVA